MRANDSSGISVRFTEAFRTSAYQNGLQNNPNATTPAAAGSSLHECGFAFDISWSRLNCEEKEKVIKNASGAGIK